MAKLNIFKHQKESDYKIWGMDSPDSKANFKKSLNTYTFSKEPNNVENGIILGDEGLYLLKNNEKKLIYDKRRKRNLLGDHNLYNVAAALCVSDILRLNLKEVANLIDSFKPLEHRMEKVGTFNEITFYNDSIATIPEATINCVKSIPNTQTVIIGGMDRGLDLSMLVDFLNKSSSIKTCIFLKETGYKICDELQKLNCDKKLIKVKDMEDAIKNAYNATEKNYACVLSPAAASYNTYKNFEERGKDYKRWIEKLQRKNN